MIRCAFVCALAGLPLLGQSASGDQGMNLYSAEKEVALGRQLAAEYRERTTAIPSGGVQQYIESLGQKLSAQAPRTTLGFTFGVIADDPCPTIHEPAALPGGYVFVPAALLLAAQDEAEFAGMLAHAMAHIIERHDTQAATRGQLMQSVSTPVLFMGSSTGCASPIALPLGLLTMQRTFERQADLLAVQVMAQAGFDPNALVRYIKRVQSSESATPAVFSPLPTRDQRVAGMLSAIAKLPVSRYGDSTDRAFEAARDEVRRFLPVNRAIAPSLRR